jgi:hypothetical protein
MLFYQLQSYAPKQHGCQYFGSLSRRSRHPRFYSANMGARSSSGQPQKKISAYFSGDFGRPWVYQASPQNFGASMSFEEDDTILVIRGFASDSIDNAGDPVSLVPLDRARGVSSSLKPIISQARGMVADWSETYVSGDTLEGAFWKTMTMNRQVSGYHRDTSTKAHRTKRLDRPDIRVPPATSHQESMLIKALEYQVGEIGPITHRRFFTTSKRYIGICPPVAQRGDVVCVLLGADTPYVLRQGSNGRYRMLGQW